MFEIRNDPRKENQNFIRCFILYEFDFPSVQTLVWNFYQFHF